MIGRQRRSTCVPSKSAHQAVRTCCSSSHRPDPKPAAGEVLIRVAAAGVNRPDVIQRQGKYPPPPGASDLPGLEVSGTIETVGEGVTHWRAGRSRLRARRRRRLRELVRGAGAAVPADSRGDGFCDRCGDSGNVLHRLDECLRSRPADARGETALVHGGSERHRHDGDSAGARARRQRDGDGRIGREVPRVRTARARARDQLPNRRLRRGRRGR